MSLCVKSKRSMLSILVALLKIGQDSLMRGNCDSINLAATAAKRETVGACRKRQTQERDNYSRAEKDRQRALPE